MLLALTDDSSVIHLESRHLNIALSESEPMQAVPLPLIKRVVITDTARVSGAVIQALLVRKIPVIFISRGGKYLGQLHYSPTGDCERKLRQQQFAEMPLLPAVCSLLESKLYNQKRVLQRAAAARKLLCVECQEIDKLYKKLKIQSSIDALRGIEGMAARSYFNALKRFFPEWCNFAGRNRQPASDPVNALLSYSYAVMTGEMENLIRLHALDPGVGFLHCNQYNRSTLTLDLIEPLRPCFCDILVLDLFSHKRLQEDNFDFMPDGSCRLTRAAKKIFFSAWEKKRQRKFRYSGVVTDWESIWNDQVMQWINYLKKTELPSFFRMP